MQCHESFLCKLFRGMAHMEGMWHATHGRNFLVHAFSRCHPSFDRSTLFNMSLLKYFQTNSSLPKPGGPLLMVVPSSSIVAVDRQVQGENTQTPTSKSGIYESFIPEKAWIGKRAVEYDVTASFLHFSYQLIAEGKYCVYVSIGGLFSFLDQLVMSGCDYLRNCARCQWPHQCRLFHASFFHKIFILCQFVKVFSLESFPLYGVYHIEGLVVHSIDSLNVATALIHTFAVDVLMEEEDDNGSDENDDEENELMVTSFPLTHHW